MHTRHFIVVPTNGVDLSNANNHAGLIDQVVIGNGEDSWWDWYQVGGRWDGEFRERFGSRIWPNAWEYPNLLPLTEENTEYALEVLKQVYEEQLEEVNRCRPEAREWAETLLSVDDPMKAIAEGPALNMGGYQMSRLMSLANGTWNPDSFFFDPVGHTANPSRLIAHLQDRNVNWDEYTHDRFVEEYALLVVDFHF